MRLMHAIILTSTVHVCVLNASTALLVVYAFWTDAKSSPLSKGDLAKLCPFIDTIQNMIMLKTSD